MADDPYDILGVDRGADMTHVRRAYLAEIRRNHPDLRPGDAAAERRTRDLNRAWEQIRSRARVAPAPSPRPRPPRQPAYSSDRQEFRLAFTTATLRVALAVLAVGLVLLAMLAR